MNSSPRFASPRWLVFWLTLLCAPILSAQETWSAVASPTTVTLWGVCYGGGQFVAVGDSGTVITSPDGITWTKRLVSTTQWLTSVTWSPAMKRFVAIGANGVFLTSVDGVTWSAITSGNTRRNGIIWGEDRFFLVGENGWFSWSFDGTEMISSVSTETGRWLRGVASGAGVVVGVGQAGRVYTLSAATSYNVPRSFIAGTGDLEGLVFANNLFTAVGWSGSVQTSPDGVTWTAHPGAPSGRALTFFNGVYAAVGENGAISTTTDPASGVWISRNSPTTRRLLGVTNNGGIGIAVGEGGTIVRSSGAPAIVGAPLTQQAAVGDTVLFRAIATGDSLTYRWTLNGQTLPDVSDSCIRTRISAADAGEYTVTVTNASGSVSATARLTLGAVRGAVVDPSFVPAAPNTAPLAVAIAGDKILIGGDFVYTVNGQSQRGIARLNADGTFDSSFAVGDGVNSTGIVSSIVVQADGKIVVGGSFSTLAGTTRTNIGRLNTDGSIDSSYAPMLPAITAASAATTQLSLDATGQVHWAAGRFSSYRISTTGTVVQNVSGIAFSIIQRSVGDAFGRIVIFENGSVSRLLGVNRDFTFQTIGAGTGFANSSGLEVLPSGGILVSADNTGVPTGATGELIRRNANGSADPTFAKLTVFDPVVPRVDVRLPFAVARDGKIYVGGDFTSLRDAARTRIARLNADGTLDATYNTQGGANGRITALAVQPDGRLIIAGEFTAVDGVARPRLARLVAEPGGYPYAPQLPVRNDGIMTMQAGDRLDLKLTAVGSGPLTYRWITPTGPVENTTGALTIDHVREFQSGGYLLTISGPGGSLLHYFVLNVTASAPRIFTAPASVSTQSGRTVTLSVEAYGGEPLTYQWYRAGTPIGTNSPTLTLTNVTAADVGDYSVVVRNGLGEIASDPVQLTLNTSSRLAAISTRAFVGTGESVTIAGFAITGTAPKKILIRGAGPALAARFGLAGALTSTGILLFNGDGTPRNSIVGWNGVTSAQMDALGLFPFDAGSKDSAMMLDLPPGNYTAQFFGATQGNTGIGLIEVYEADNGAGRLLAISTRAFVGTGDALAIPGIAINGPSAKKILVRAIGPTMASLGISAPLADPILTLVNAGTGDVVATNDDWSSSSNKADIIAASAAAGNFPLPDPSKDAVLLVTVPPGNYTALVRGANGGTGVALVEVYEVP